MKAKEQTDVEATQPSAANEMEEAIFDKETITTPNSIKRQLREQKLKAIQFLEIPRKKSSDLVGVEFNIVDAVRGHIKEDLIVTFILLLKSGERIATSKPLNVFTESYLDYFESYDASEEIEPMQGYTFTEIEGGTAGNKPIVLRKL